MARWVFSPARKEANKKRERSKKNKKKKKKKKKKKSKVLGRMAAIDHGCDIDWNDDVEHVFGFCVPRSSTSFSRGPAFSS